MVFEDEVSMLADRKLFYVESVSDTVKPVDELLAVVDSVVGHNAEITGLTVYNDRNRTYKVSLSYPRRASVFINQYNGDFLGYYERLPFFKFIYSLHRWLLDERSEEVPYTFGRRLVGISVLVMIVILLSGTVIWVPGTIKSLKNRLSVCTVKGVRRFLYDLHVSAGFYSFLLLLILSLTGLTWSFPVYRNFIYSTFGDSPEEKFDLKAVEGNGMETSVYKSWNRALSVLKSRYPDNDITFTCNQANVHHSGWGNKYAYDICQIDGQSGEITGNIQYSEQNRSSKIKGWILSLHLGQWGGIAGKCLTFAVGFIGAILPLTGYYIWYRKGKNRIRRR